jgi:MFS family permease
MGHMRLGLLRDQDYRRYWIGESISMTGSAMAVVAMPLTAVLVLHAGVFEIGLLQATAWLPALLVGLPVGAWVDGLRRKRPVMVAADVVSFALFASVPIAAWAGVLTMWQLVVVAFFGGVAQVFFSSAYMSFLRAVVKEEDFDEANAKLESSFWAGELAAPGLAGLIAQWLGAVIGVVVNAVSFLVSAVYLVRIRSTESAPAAEAPESSATSGASDPSAAAEDTGKQSLWADIVEGLDFLVHEPYIRLVALYEGMANFGECILNAVVVVFLVRTVGVAAGIAGVLLAAPGAGGVIGSLVAPRIGQRLGSARTILVCATVASPCMLLVPLTSRGFGVAFFVIGFFSYATGVAVSNVVAQTFTMSYVPEHLLGRFSSTLYLVIKGTQPLGAVVGAVIAGAVGTRPAMWAAAVAITLSAGILYLGPIRSHRDFPVKYPPEAVSA